MCTSENDDTLLEAFRQVTMTIPLVDTIQHIDGYYVAYKTITLSCILFIFIEMKFIHCHSCVMFVMKSMSMCND